MAVRDDFGVHEVQMRQVTFLRSIVLFMGKHSATDCNRNDLLLEAVHAIVAARAGVAADMFCS